MSEHGEAGRLARLLAGRISKWPIAAILIVVGIACFPIGAKLADVQSNDAGAWLPGDAESTKVLEKSGAFYSPNEFPAIVVFERSGGLTAADQEAMRALPAVFEKDQGVTRTLGPLPPTDPTDKEAAQIIVFIDSGTGGWNALGDTVDRMRDQTKSMPEGLSVHFTGPAGYAADSIKAFAGIDSTLLYAAVIVVVLCLLVTYRSPLLWALPVFSVMTAYGIAQAIVYALAKYADLTVNAQTASILPILVLGAGTDYGMLLIARYREELHNHRDRHDALALAVHRAGAAILASASTVVLGMLCLMLASMNSTKGLGPVAAIAIVVAFISSMTLLPALLVIFGRWFFWPLVPRFGTPDHAATGLWAHVGSAIARRPRPVWIVTALVLGAVAFGVTGLQAHGLQNKDSFTKAQESVTGEAVLQKHFDAGSGTPLVVVANADRADAVVAALKTVPGVDPTAVTQPQVKGGVAYLEATMTAAPDSAAARDVVKAARTTLHAVPGGNALVGGGSAFILDTIDAATADNLLIIPIVLLVVLLILALLLRSILAPVLLLGTVVLSYLAALGISTLVFTKLLDFHGADASFPLFVFVFLVALGIDYNIFLMTRVREESIDHGTRQGALLGLRATGGVITSAGLVLAGTFGVLGTLPLVFAAELGIAVALGVLMDTIIVRSVLVTALTLDIGDRIWWPSTLSRHGGAAGAPDQPELETV
jgi:RND superfamily putative drug exporter